MVASRTISVRQDGDQRSEGEEPEEGDEHLVRSPPPPSRSGCHRYCESPAGAGAPGRASSRERRERATGLEPATFSLEGDFRSLFSDDTR